MKRHGTSSSYRSGCRCDACVAWNRERAAGYAELKRDVQPATFRFSFSCPYCGGTPELIADGVPTASGTEVRAVAKCSRNGCRREWILELVARSTSGHELELPKVAVS